MLQINEHLKTPDLFVNVKTQCFYRNIMQLIIDNW